MMQITARIPDDLAPEIDAAAAKLKCSRAQVVRQALEYYLEDLEDLRLGLERLQDPADLILDWGDVRRELVAQIISPPPPEPTRNSVHGCMAETTEIVGDLLDPLLDDDWEVSQ